MERRRRIHTFVVISIEPQALALQLAYSVFNYLSLSWMSMFVKVDVFQLCATCPSCVSFVGDAFISSCLHDELFMKAMYSRGTERDGCNKRRDKRGGAKEWRRR